MIYHWCPATDWDSAEDFYVAPSLAEEGFIHFSFRTQVADTASELDRGRTDLVLLSVDEANLSVVVEDSYGLGVAYPHVYGPIPTDAVLEVTPFPCGPDGRFVLPDSGGRQS